ncbi:MAG: HipA domain-containing protein [Gammaproteobacteria bacterium]
MRVLDLLKGSDDPSADQATVLKAQVLFWLIGATDGHAKNFSLFIGPGGSFHLAPLYDVLTAQPSLDARQIERKQMKLAMSVGTNRHYRISEIVGRHFLQTGEQAHLPRALVLDAVETMARIAEAAIERLEHELPAHFPEEIHRSVKAAVSARLPMLELGGLA